jgi:hypothetical protein
MNWLLEKIWDLFLVFLNFIRNTGITLDNTLDLGNNAEIFRGEISYNTC